MPKAKETKIVYNEKDRAIVSALKESGSAMTLSELCEATGMEIKAGNINGTVGKGLIAAGEKREIERNGKRNVATYVLVNAEPTVKSEKDGKTVMNAYSDTEKAILGALSNEPQTLAQLSEKLGKTLVSGNINGLVKKGNVAKGEDVTITVKVPAEVNTYVFVKDIPADAE